MEEKIKIIDEIVKRHPSYGTKNGWSEYVGGMIDTGQWFYNKMTDAPIEELQLFLDNIIAEENNPPIIYTEEELADMKIINHLPNGGYMNEYTRKQLEKFAKAREKKLLGL
jgi:hypothetical protein